MSVGTHDRRQRGKAMKTLLLATACAAANAAVWSPAQAQTQSGSQTTSQVLEEIVVTAERRRTSLQVTPIAATVMTGEKLADSGVTVVDQLQFISPGATVNNFGQGIDFNHPRHRQGRAQHADDHGRHHLSRWRGHVPRDTSQRSLTTTSRAWKFCAARRARSSARTPQGGAVFVTSQDPVINGGTTGYIQGQIADYSGYGAQGALNLPVSDTFAARAAFNGEARDSFYDIAGPHTGDDGVKTGSARLGFLWAPSESLSVLLKTDYNYLDLSGYPSDPVNATNDLFDITANGDMHALDRFGRAVLKIDYTFGNGTTLRSVSGYQDGRTEYRADLDGTSVGNSLFGDKVDETIYSQELNLISPDMGRFTWVLGAYYQDDEYDFLPGEFYIVSPAGRYELEGRIRSMPRPCSVSSRSGSQTRSSCSSVRAIPRLTPAITSWSISSACRSCRTRRPSTRTPRQGRAELDRRSEPLPVRVRRDRLPAGRFERPRRSRLARAVRRGAGDELRDRLEGRVGGWQRPHAAQCLLQRLRAVPGHRRLPDDSDLRLRAERAESHDDLRLRSAARSRIRAVLARRRARLDAQRARQVLRRRSTHPELRRVQSRDWPGNRIVHRSGRQRANLRAQLHVQPGVQYDFALASGDRITPRVNYGHVSEQWATLFENEARGDRVEARNIVNAQIAWRHDSWVNDAVWREPDGPALRRGHQLRPALRRCSSHVRSAPAESLLTWRVHGGRSRFSAACTS
jgi:iron complex outermembrane receptor protein